MFRRLLGCVVAALVVAAAADARAATPENRVALVIGIGDYSRSNGIIPSLDHPVPDALAVASELKKLGIKTTFKSDLSKDELLIVLDAFTRDSQGADLVLIYFAGHGAQIAGINYLLPIDVNMDTADNLKSSSLPLDELLVHAAAASPHGERIILIDACRELVGKEREKMAKALNDPAQPVVPGVQSLGTIDGTIYAFATRPGGTASDGTGPHSPFATSFLQHVGTKGITFHSVMKIVQQEVYDSSRGDQLPYLDDGMPDALLSLAGGEAVPLDERDQLLLAMAGINPDIRGQVERIANANDAPLAPLYGALLTEVHPGAIDAQLREKLLENAAKAFVELRTQIKTLSSFDPQVTELRQEAERQLALGAFNRARAALSKAIDIDHGSAETLEARLKLRTLSEATTHALLGGANRTQLRYRDEATELAVAARLAERADYRQLAWQYTLAQADALYRQGDEFGDNQALSEAIDVSLRALALTSRATHVDEWTDTQNILALALIALGERLGDNTRLEQAVAAYHEVLKERTREQAPLDWAKANSNLGRALMALGNAGERLPRGWEKTETSFSTLLTVKAKRIASINQIYQAIDAFREALKESTLERAPLEWARTHNNLGLALLYIGERDDDPVQFENAIAAFRDALTQYPRERSPLAWALIKNNLGAALSNLGRRTGDTAGLEEAVTNYRDALKERTRQRVPLDWAATQNNLAVVLATLGERNNDTERFEEAVTVFREALSERTREREPLPWARTMTSLGNVLAEIGRREEAITVYREVLFFFETSGDAENSAVLGGLIAKTIGVLGIPRRRL